MELQSRKLITQSLSPLQPTTTPLPPSGAPSTFFPGHFTNSNSNSVIIAVILGATAALLLICLISKCLNRDLDDLDNELASGRPRSGQQQQGTASNPPKGVDPTKIRALPVYSYFPNAKNKLDCPICLSEFEAEEAVKVIIPFCKHVFHFECIERWLSSQDTCPVCRSTQLFEEGKGGPEHLGVREESCESGGRSAVGSGEILLEVMRFGRFSFDLTKNSSCWSFPDRTAVERTSTSF